MYTGIPGGPKPKTVDPHAQRFLAKPQVAKALARQRRIVTEEKQPDTWRRVLGYLGTVPPSTAIARRTKEAKNRNYTAHTLSAQPKGLELREGFHQLNAGGLPLSMNTKLESSCAAPEVALRSSGGRKAVVAASNPQAASLEKICSCFGDSENPCVACAVLDRRRKMFAPSTPLEYALSIQRPVNSTPAAPRQRPQSAGPSRKRHVETTTSKDNQEGHPHVQHLYIPKRPLTSLAGRGSRQSGTSTPRYLQATTSSKSKPGRGTPPPEHYTQIPSAFQPAPSSPMHPQQQQKQHFRHGAPPNPPPRPPTPILRPSTTDDLDDPSLLPTAQSSSDPFEGDRAISSASNRPSSRVTFTFQTASAKKGKKITSRLGLVDDNPGPAYVPTCTGRQFRAACTIQAWFVGNDERRWLRQQKRAALSIQRIYRAVLRRRACYYAAFLLQSVGRGMLIRHRFNLYAHRKWFHTDEHSTRNLILAEHNAQRAIILQQLAQQLDVMQDETQFRHELNLHEAQDREEFMVCAFVTEGEALHRGQSAEKDEPSERENMSQWSFAALALMHKKLSLEKGMEAEYLNAYSQWHSVASPIADQCHFQILEMGLEPANRRTVEHVELDERITMVGKLVLRWHFIHLLRDATRSREAFLRTLIEEEQCFWYQRSLHSEFVRHSLMARYMEGAELVKTFEAVERKNLEKRIAGKYVA